MKFGIYILYSQLSELESASHANIEHQRYDFCLNFSQLLLGNL